jgi:hypothetical protein
MFAGFEEDKSTRILILRIKISKKNKNIIARETVSSLAKGRNVC